MSSKIPYGFVPVNIEKAHTAAPVYHHGANTNQAGLLSGELHIEMTTVTPTIVGNHRYPASAASHQDLGNGRVLLQGEFGLDHPVSAQKSILEPLFAPAGSSAHGAEEQWKTSVLIPPRSIKGLLRHSLGALLNAPMERVKDRQYAFRPNLDRDYSETATKCRPAVVRKVAYDETTQVMTRLELAFINCLNAPWWIHSSGKKRVSDSAIRSAFGSCEVGAQCKPGAKISDAASYTRGRRTYIQCQNGGNVSLNESFELCAYYAGADGSGVLEAAHRGSESRTAVSKYKWLIVPKSQIQEKSLVISGSSELLTNLARTYRFLSSTLSHLDGVDEPVAGHLDDHPKLSETAKVSEAILKRSRWHVGQIVFVEIEGTKSEDLIDEPMIRSLGHHFRYWWAYRDSVKSEGVHSDKGGPRAGRRVVMPLLGERTAESNAPGDADSPPAELSGARALLGYARDKRNSGTAIGSGDFGRLAGRLTPNFAVEVLRITDDETTRFMDGVRARILPILGTPKPSSAELYLRQDPEVHLSNSEPPNRVNTYGEIRPAQAASQLSGRKFYRHANSAAPDFGQLYASTQQVIEELRLAAKEMLCREASQTHGRRHASDRGPRPVESVATLPLLPADAASGLRWFAALSDEQIDHLTDLIYCKPAESGLTDIEQQIGACRNHQDVYPLLSMVAAIPSGQSTIVRFVSKPGRKFRFALRFRDLRPAELALVIAVLEPQRLAAAIGQAGDRTFGHKLGYGRPLGFGSVQFSVKDRFRVFRPSGGGVNEPVDEALEPFVERHLGEALTMIRGQDACDDTLKCWLDLLQIVPDQTLEYPTLQTAGQKRTIYAWHTQVRRNHSKARSGS